MSNGVETQVDDQQRERARRRNSHAMQWILNGLTLVFIGLAAVMMGRRGSSGLDTRTNEVYAPPNIDLIRETASSAGTYPLTVVLALSVHCKWCSESADLYRRIGEASSGRANVVAIFPEMTSEANKYLKALGVTVPSVKQAPFAKLGITATPTIWVVDSQGRIKRNWRGKLSDDREEEVFAAIAGKDSPSRSAATLLDGDSLIARSKRNDDPQLLDIRPRERFAQGHLEGSLNIPNDELDARARRELTPEIDVAVYCHYCSPCEAQAYAESAPTYCSSGIEHLRRLGFDRVLVVNADLASLSSKGLKVVGSVSEPVFRNAVAARP